jgi:hypothetical protein
MIATLYNDRNGKAEFDIIATRDADITEATRSMAVQAGGPGALRLLAVTKAGALLEAAQRKINNARENTADFFFYNDPQLGAVHIAWVEG